MAPRSTFWAGLITIGGKWVSMDGGIPNYANFRQSPMPARGCALVSADGYWDKVSCTATKAFIACRKPSKPTTGTINFHAFIEFEALK